MGTAGRDFKILHPDFVYEREWWNLVDTCALGAHAARYGGSNPPSRIQYFRKVITLTLSKSLPANSPVLVVRLGDGKEYLGRIRGLGTTGCYIVECNYSLATYGYPCFSVPEGCLQELTEAQYSEIAHSTGCVQFKPDLL